MTKEKVNEKYVTSHCTCDICGHKEVSVMPESRYGSGNECPECGNMSVYPDEESADY